MSEKNEQTQIENPSDFIEFVRLVAQTNKTHKDSQGDLSVSNRHCPLDRGVIRIVDGSYYKI